MKKSGDVIRLYSRNDEGNVIRLHNETTNAGYDPEFWNWKYFSNPKGPGWVNVAESGKEVVGQYSLMRYHLNFMGEEIVAAQSSDTVVRGDQRRKRWMTRLADHVYAKATRDGAWAIFGFPNRNSYPVAMKQLDFVRLCHLIYYNLRLGGNGTARRLMGPMGTALHFFTTWLRCVINAKLKMKNVRVEKTTDLPDGIADFLKVINTYEVLSVWKDADYLRWRYLRNPRHSYVLYPLFVNDILEGLVVVRKLGTLLVICEMLSRSKDIQLGMVHLLHVLKANFFSGIKEVAFLGHDNGYFETVFGRIGFGKSYSHVVCLGRVPKEGKFKQVFMIPDNWTFVYGDTDII